MDQSRSVTGHFEIIRVTLTVATPVDGAPSPAVGTWTNDWGTVVTCEMVNATVTNLADTRRDRCSGWIGTGSVPASGSDNSVTILHTTNSTITWTWDTDYRIYSSATAFGIVIPALSYGNWMGFKFRKCNIQR